VVAQLYSGITVSSGETLQLAAGDTASSVTVASGGTLIVSSGGVAAGTIIAAGGTENVLASGAAYSTTLSGGTMNFGSGAFLGTFGKITFAGGGTLRILDFLTYFNSFPSISGVGAGDIIDLASFADPRSVPTSAFINFDGFDLDISQTGFASSLSIRIGTTPAIAFSYFRTAPAEPRSWWGPFRTSAASPLAPDRR
jgi:autotransporter passenger strand-loop-strand repeat protein